MTRPAGSDTTTEGIRVIAEAQFLPEESEPEQRQFVYAYRIRLRNEGTRRARLASRHWIILDADNHREDVRGPGVVGKHPDLKPGDEFEYTSGCSLRTKWGTMEGTYTFEREDGTPFDVAIGRFFLVPPVTAGVGR
ncbi:MAG: Co2+/Mg2+ efflux protein ApaG [Planctomycetota bacterium]